MTTTGNATTTAPAPAAAIRAHRLSPRMVDVLAALYRGEADRLPDAGTYNTITALRARGLVDYRPETRGHRFAAFVLTADGVQAAVEIQLAATTHGGEAAVVADIARDERAAEPADDADAECGQCGSPRGSARHAGHADGHAFVAPAAEPADDDEPAAGPITTTVRTDELAPGDIVFHHDMYIVLGEHTTTDRACGLGGVQTVHHFRGDVTNADAIRATPGGHVTDGLLRDDNRWSVQGTAFAWWQRVERCACGPLVRRTTAEPATCGRPATRTVRTLFADALPACAEHGDEYARTSGIVQP